MTMAMFGQQGEVGGDLSLATAGHAAREMVG